jgi:hypothetical protein
MSRTCCTSPSRAHGRQVRAHPVHLVLVGAGQCEDELRVGAAQDGATVEQAAVEKRLAEASVLDFAMIVLSRSKNAAARRSSGIR